MPAAYDSLARSAASSLGETASAPTAATVVCTVFEVIVTRWPGASSYDALAALAMTVPPADALAPPPLSADESGG